MEWTGVIFGMGVLVLGTVILVVVLIVAERFYRARAQRHDLVRLQAVVQRYDEHSQESTKHQQATDASLAEITSRLTEIERMMREVE